MFGLLTAGKTGVQVGVDFMSTGVAAVSVSTAKNNSGEILNSEFLPAVGASDQTRALRDWVQQNGLKKADCICLIAHQDVEIFQLEKPSVSDSELIAAVTWKLKDLVSYDLASAVVDVFEIPESSKSRARHINAVVSHESVVGGYVESIREAGLNLKAIDVHQLVVRNLPSANNSTDTPYAQLLMLENEGLLSILRNGDLYVSRDFKVGLSLIQNAADQIEDVYDNVLLELQRSMDYFENNYGVGAVRKMAVFPQTPVTERMITYLQNFVAYELDFVQIGRKQAGAKPLDANCFTAYCASLRGVVS